MAEDFRSLSENDYKLEIYNTKANEPEPKDAITAVHPNTNTIQEERRHPTVSDHRLRSP